MTKTEWTLRGIMSVPVIGWVYLLIGIARPFERKLPRAFWWLVVSMNGGLHACQLPIAFPIGKKLGLSNLHIITKTMLFGAAWWKPLQSGLIRK